MTECVKVHFSNNHCTGLNIRGQETSISLARLSADIGTRKWYTCNLSNIVTDDLD